MIGERIAGRYELAERLGSGASSSVWLARDATGGAEVAIKLLHVERSERPEAVARFEREGRALEALHHPHVVEVLDRGEHDGRPFIAFELVRGETLRERLRRTGPLPAAEALAIGEGIAAGLAAAHARRLVHRDLKPANVLLTPAGGVKVADFGIAHALEEPRLTQAGRVLGTGEYVSPEQALGHPFDTRSDLYALGVVLFELVAGRPPFRGTAFTDVAAQHVRAAPPTLASAQPDAPPALSALVARLLAKSPDDRPDDAEAVRAELHAMRARLAVDDGATGELGPLPALPEPPGAAQGAPPLTNGQRRETVRAADLDELAPWEDLSQPDLPAAVASLATPPFRVPPSARRDAGPIRWLAVAALGAALLTGVLIWTLTGDGEEGAAGPATTAATAATTEAATATTAPATTAPAAAAPVRVAQASSFDPEGDGAENDAAAPLAIDGDESTAWESEIYRGTADLTSFKGGVGLVLQLARSVRLRSVGLVTPAPGFTVSVYVSQDEVAPTALRDWTPAAGTQTVTGRSETLRLDRVVRARHVLLWVPQLAPARSGAFSVQIAEATPRR